MILAKGHPISEMPYHHVIPMPFQVFSNEPTMAILGRRFTAQHAHMVKFLGPVAVLWPPLLQQQIEEPFVLGPVHLAFLLESVQNVRRGSEVFVVEVFDFRDNSQKVFEVFLLGEPRQL